MFKFPDTFIEECNSLDLDFVEFKLLPKFVQDGILSFLFETKVSFHPDFQQKNYFVYLFFTLQDLENLGM